jgi:hypothetical protein
VADLPRLTPIEEFIVVDEPGADALLGTLGEVLIPEGGDVMVYGNGGAGKTTLLLDLAHHLAAGDDWCGIAIRQPISVAWIENEGPRPLFRRKLRDKFYSWDGSAIGDRIRVLEQPWATFTFADEQHRQWLADAAAADGVQVVVVGPLTRVGMNEAGTLQETRDFAALLDDVRRRLGRPLTFILVHHENKGGQVSGAWEGAGDTLLHVQAQGHGRTRLVVQKARWASAWHGKSLQLTWAANESFTIDELPTVDDSTVADQIIAAAKANPGCSWNVIERDHVRGNKARGREIRDRLLAAGQLVDALADSPGKTMALYDAEHAPSPLRLPTDTGQTHPDTPPDALNAANGHHDGASPRPDADAPWTHHPESGGASGASALRKDAPPDADAPADTPPIDQDEVERLAALATEYGA